MIPDYEDSHRRFTDACRRIVARNQEPRQVDHATCTCEGFDIHWPDNPDCALFGLASDEEPCLQVSQS